MSAHFHWFGPESVTKLRDALNAATAAARLEVHTDGEAMTLHVVEPDAAAVAGGGVNESHVCPPFCP